MSAVTISYKGSSISSMDASGSKTLQTSGKYCEGDIIVNYQEPEYITYYTGTTDPASSLGSDEDIYLKVV